MKIFYQSYLDGNVAAGAAVERLLEEVLGLFTRMDEDDFLGIELDGQHVLQFRCEEQLIYTEVLDTRSRTIEFCVLPRPLAEEVIRKAYSGDDFRKLPTESLIEWQHEKLA